jgi:hypothetical protein
MGKRMGSRGMDWFVLGWRHMAGCCTPCNEISHAIDSGKFLDWLRNYLLLKKNSELWTSFVR